MARFWQNFSCPLQTQKTAVNAGDFGKRRQRDETCEEVGLQRIGDLDKSVFLGVEILLIARRQSGLMMLCQRGLKSIRQFPTMFSPQLSRQVGYGFIDNQELILVKEWYSMPSSNLTNSTSALPFGSLLDGLGTLHFPFGWHPPGRLQRILRTGCRSELGSRPV
jgi:hypothetical protein